MHVLTQRRGPRADEGRRHAGMHDDAGIPLNRSLLGKCGKVCGSRWGTCTNRLILRSSTTLVFPVEDLGGRPDGYGAPLALKQGLDFSKAPLRGAVFLLPWVRARKSSPEGEKMGSNPDSNPIFAHFRLIFLANLPEGLIQIFPFYLTTRKWQDRSGHHGYH